jgi:FKBP-type peptidyl-prolyl cis-trans isomerase SlyD
MQIAKNKVAAIHYTLTDNDGNTIDSSQGRDPLLFIQGVGNLIPGMEEGLEGRARGDKFKIKVRPEKGYGEINPKLVQDVPRKSFGDQEVQPGMQFQTTQGQVLTVKEVKTEVVIVDANHPLAGRELNFDVEVIEVREATKEELDHGHVHGKGGHHH